MASVASSWMQGDYMPVRALRAVMQQLSTMQYEMYILITVSEVGFDQRVRLHESSRRYSVGMSGGVLLTSSVFLLWLCPGSFLTGHGLFVQSQFVSTLR